MKKTDLAFRLAFVLLILGMGASAYLTVHHTQLTYGLAEGSSICNLGGSFDCDTVNTSRFSEIFNVPVAAIALVGFFVQLLFLLGSRFLGSQEQGKPGRFFFYLSVVDAFAALGLALVSSFVLKNFCLFCVGLYVIILLKLVCSYVLLSGKPQLMSDLSSLVFPVSADEKSYGILVLLFTIPVGALIFNGMIKESLTGGADIDKMVKRSVVEWQNGQAQQFTFTRPPDFGDADAPNTIVEFSDFQCPACKRASKGIHMFMKLNSSKVKFYYENFPLDSTCNDKAGPVHKYACMFAKVGICARAQGKFREAHDWIFENQEFLNESKIKELTTLLGLDQGAFDQCFASGDTLEIIKQQIQAGEKAGVRGTPSVFFNGRLLPAGGLLPVLNKALDLSP